MVCIGGSFDSSDEYRHVEVDQRTGRQLRQFQVRDDLCVVEKRERFHRRKLKNKSIPENEVKPVARFYGLDLYGNFADELYALQNEFARQADSVR